jgi:hypothetical protein
MMPQTEVPTQVVVQVPPANKAPAPGYKSSELWATVATVVPLAMGLVPAPYAPVVAAVTGVYVAARTLLKVVHAMGYAKAVPDLPNVTGESQ